MYDLVKSQENTAFSYGSSISPLPPTTSWVQEKGYFRKLTDSQTLAQSRQEDHGWRGCCRQLAVHGETAQVCPGHGFLHSLLAPCYSSV